MWKLKSRELFNKNRLFDGIGNNREGTKCTSKDSRFGTNLDTTNNGGIGVDSDKLINVTFTRM